MNSLSKSSSEDENSIIFECTGAIDYSEKINIELSLTHKLGFLEIKPNLLIRKLFSFKHIQSIIICYFIKIVKRMPHISDDNESLPKEYRFTSVYYRCYKKFHHSHDHWDKYEYTELSLNEAIDYIDKENLGIRLPNSINLIF